ncbi:MAG: cold shock domain-containing protein [Chloroflexi bacterium]|nr:cold shock domain-containing protein [Chloroflexota bacterium]
MSPLRDRELVCARCQTRFLYTVAEQRQHAREGHSAPYVLCPGCRALQHLLRRRRGVVKWYDRRKGYGFAQDEQGGDVFIHVSEVRGKVPRRGQTVEYRLEETERGSAAKEVVVQG